MKPILLSYAGLDPSAGAGILADFAVFEHLGCRGMAVATALTAQNSRTVSDWQLVGGDLLKGQLKAIWDDFSLAGLKSGMLGSLEAVQVLAEQLEEEPLPHFILDPVLVSSSGRPMLTPEAQEEMVKRLFPLADLITPNLPELEALTGLTPQTEEEFAQAGAALLALGPKAVLIKGGHAPGQATDRLYSHDATHRFSSPRLSGASPHGTGCHLSSAILAYLAQGRSLPDAVDQAKCLLQGWIANAAPLGQGKPYLHI